MYDGTGSTTLRLRSVDECEVPPGFAELVQLHMESNSQRSQHLFRKFTIISHSQRLGYKRAGPSGLAELTQLLVE